MNRLFDDICRNYTGPSLRSESTYSFLNRSSHPGTEKIRNMLQRWIDRLPQEHRKKVVSDMRNIGRGSISDDIQFDAAFFELFLHEFLLGTGAKIEVQPKINSRTPDFRVYETTSVGKDITYVIEATDLDLGRGTGQERHQNDRYAIDALNEILSPDFGLFIKMTGNLVSTPKKSLLKRPFEDLIEGIAYHEIHQIYEAANYDQGVLPTASFSHDGWKMVGTLFPVSTEYRGITRPIVVASSKNSADIVDDIGRTKEKLNEKAKKYRHIDNLIIALRCDISNDRLHEALFGRQQIAIYSHNNLTSTAPLPRPYFSQRRDGFWPSSNDRQNQHVIGVVAFYNVHPWTLDRDTAIYFPNPYITMPMPDWTTTISHAKYSEGPFEIVEGSPPHKFLSDLEAIGNLYG